MPVSLGEAGTVSDRMDSDAIVIQFVWANILSTSPFHSVAVSKNAFEISRIGKLPIPVSADIGLYIKILCFSVVKGHTKHIVLHRNNGFCRWTQHSGHLTLGGHFIVSVAVVIHRFRSNVNFSVQPGHNAVFHLGVFEHVIVLQGLKRGII